MTTPTASLVVDFAAGGNSDAMIREGWSASHRALRWSVGEQSRLVLPALSASPYFAMTLECHRPPVPSARPRLIVELNGVALTAAPPTHGVPRTIVVPGHMINDSGENTLVLRNPDVMTVAEPTGRRSNTRPLAFGWRWLELRPEDAPEFADPTPLPDADPADLPMQVVVRGFQSLGQNCELGVFQRRCGAEPLGLLRFASIFPAQLVLGLRTRFAEVDAPDKLTLKPAGPDGELMGRHALYGFSYHTFRKETDVDVEEFRAKEPLRLGYLRRMLLEELDNDKKIFVRLGGFEAESEMRALFGLLRSFNPNARLLMVQQDAARAGRVESLAPNLYRGYLSKFADAARVPGTLAYEDWLRVCAVLYCEQRRAGRAPRYD